MSKLEENVRMWQQRKFDFISKSHDIHGKIMALGSANAALMKSVREEFVVHPEIVQNRKKILKLTILLGKVESKIRHYDNLQKAFEPRVRREKKAQFKMEKKDE